MAQITAILQNIKSLLSEMQARVFGFLLALPVVPSTIS